MREVEVVDEEPADELRPARRRRLFPRPALVAHLVVAAVFAIAAVGLVEMANDHGPEVSVLDREQRASDTLPDVPADGLVATSSRRLAGDGNATFWVVLNQKHLYCFVVVISGPGGVAGSTCVSGAALAGGVRLSVNAGGVSVSAARRRLTDNT
jgi:hypothetical protein